MKGLRQKSPLEEENGVIIQMELLNNLTVSNEEYMRDFSEMGEWNYAANYFMTYPYRPWKEIYLGQAESDMIFLTAITPVVLVVGRSCHRLE